MEEKEKNKEQKVEKKEDKEVKQKMGNLNLDSAKIIHPGDNQKSVLLTTDGETVNVQWNLVNKLEIEMMLTKALQFIKTR